MTFVIWLLALLQAHNKDDLTDKMIIFAPNLTDSIKIMRFIDTNDSLALRPWPYSAEGKNRAVDGYLIKLF